MNALVAPYVAAERLGLTAIRAGVLMALFEAGRPVRFGELHRTLGVVVKSQLVRAHQTLTKGGLVARRVCQDDRTTCEFTLTDRGQRIALELKEAVLYGSA